MFQTRSNLKVKRLKVKNPCARDLCFPLNPMMLVVICLHITPLFIRSSKSNSIYHKMMDLFLKRGSTPAEERKKAKQTFNLDEKRRKSQILWDLQFSQ